MRRWAALALLGVGSPLALLSMQCGGGEPGASNDDLLLPDRIDRTDAGSADARPSPLDAAIDQSPPAPRCDPSKPFGTPVRIAEFDPDAAHSTPRLSSDKLSIYFTTHAADASVDLSMASRSSAGEPFSNEQVLPQSTAANDHDPMVSADHLSLWFHSTRNGTADIFVATRSSTDTPFGEAAMVPTIDQPTTNENHAYFRTSGSELWFISDRPGTAGGYDVFVSKRTGDTFADPARVAELSSSARDWQPQPSEDGLTILFASDRDGGLGALDLWIARRTSVDVPFDPPTAITELNSPNVEQAGWLSADGCRIWFSSGRNTGDTVQQLFFAERPY